MKKIHSFKLFSLVLTCATLPYICPAQCLLSGYVCDTAGAGIPYCTVSLQDENRTVIAGTVSDTAGRYRLTIQPGKNYFVACSHLAFQSTSVPVTASRDTTVNFALVTATNRIDPVVVTAKFIDYKAGKYTVGISGNPIAENRSTQELLGLLPGVTSYDSEYKINGQPVSIIYIGDREITNRKELEALRAEDIERIEIQNKAGSAYDATLTGGIIRITLKKLNSGSLYGNVYASSTFSKVGTHYSVGVPFAAKYKNLNIYNYLFGGFLNETVDSWRNELFHNQNYRIEAAEKIRAYHKTMGETLSLVYEPNNRHSLGVSGSGYWISSEPRTTQASTYHKYMPDRPASLPEAAYTRYRQEGTITNYQYQATLNYKFKLDTIGSVLDVKADYIHANINKHYGYTTNGYENDTTLSLIHTDKDRETYIPRSRQFDSRISWNRVFTENRSLNTGARYYFTDLRNTTTIFECNEDIWIPQQDRSHDFRNRITGAALYTEYADSYGKFSYLLGLNFQWDRIAFRENGSSPWNKRDFYRLFPNASFAYAWNNSRLNLDLSRYSGSLPTTELVPKAIRINNNTYSIGNPGLDPSDGYDAELSLILNGQWSLGYMYSMTKNNGYHKIFYDPADPGIIYKMPVNYGRSYYHNLSIEYNVSVTKWLRISTWIYGSWAKRYLNEKVSIDKWIDFNLDCYFQILPSFGGRLSFSADTPRNFPEERWNGTYGLYGSLYKTFFKNNLHVEVSFAGLIHNDRVVTSIKADGTYSSRFWERGRREWFRLSVSYRFNHKAKKEINRVQQLLGIQQIYD